MKILKTVLEKDGFTVVKYISILKKIVHLRKEIAHVKYLQVYYIHIRNLFLKINVWGFLN